jgi:uncharacterized protein (TIGR02996 family)
MNHQQRAFLEEVIANPSDDTPRLIYADYLEEAGDPRGEFIRLQCELEQLDILNPRYLDTIHRCEELLSEHDQTWTGEHSQDLRVSAFHRGFIDTVTVRARAFLEEGESLYRDMPVHWLRFNYVKGLGAQLAATEALSKIECLDLAGLKVPDEDLIALLNSTHLTNLRALKLGSWETPVSAEIGKAISGMPSAAKIQQLHLSPGDGFFREFASGVGLPNLHELSLGMTHWLDGLSELKIESLNSLSMTGTLDQANVTTLCSLPLSKVKILHCNMLRLETDAFGQLAEQGIFHEVEDFRFNNGEGLTADHCQRIFRSGQLSSLKKIEIASRNYIPEETSAAVVQMLANGEWVTSLQQLRVSQLTESHLDVISSSPVFANLQSLIIENSRLGRNDLDSFCQSHLLDSLRRLTLPDLAMKHGLSPLAAVELPNLLRLDLGPEPSSTLQETMVLKLVRSEAFPNLQRLGLNLRYKNLSAKALVAIANESHLPELREVDFRGNRVTRKSAEVLFGSNRLPKLFRLIHSADDLHEYLQEKYGCQVSYEY